MALKSAGMARVSPKSYGWKLQELLRTRPRKQIAQTVATSNLVKTTLRGDANWGRVMAALGRAGVPIDPSRISLKFWRDPDGAQGTRTGARSERALTKVFKAKEFTILIDLAKARPGHTCGPRICHHEYVQSTRVIARKSPRGCKISATMLAFGRFAQ